MGFWNEQTRPESCSARESVLRSRAYGKLGEAMEFSRSWRFAVLALLGALLSGAADGQVIKGQAVESHLTSGHIVLAKVGLESFTAEQRQWFWKKVEFYAAALAFVRVCGRDPNFEQRIVAAARDCATDRAIEVVRAVFHQKLAAQAKLDPPTICKVDAARGLAESLEKSLNQAIEDVAQACRSCLTC